MLRQTLATCALLSLTALLPLAHAGAQPADPAELLQRDVGRWDVELKMFGAPGSEPIVSHGTETNVLVGERWLVGHFEGEVMGAPFEGSRRTGFDPEAEEIVSSWVDSTSHHVTDLAGAWDEETDTLTLSGTGRSPQGGEVETRMVVRYHEDGSRTSTMSMVVGGEAVPMLEFRYTPAGE